VWLVGLVGRVVLAILMLLLGLALAPCLLFSPTGTTAPAITPHLAPPPSPVSSLGWFANLQLALFWTAVFVGLFFLLRIYWRDRRGAGSWGIWQILLGWWRSLWIRLKGWKNQVATRLRRPAPQPATGAKEARPGWWERWRARTARERVRRFYLAMLNRAGRAGYARQPHQTPYEYAPKLSPHLADEAEALDQLTQAFVEARYSRRAFPPHQVTLLHWVWQRLQAALRRLR